MIFDFGCLSWHDKLAHIWPALLGSAACLYIFAGLTAMGAALRKSDTYHIRDSLLGWGITGILTTGVAISFPQPLFYVFVLCLVIFTGFILYKARAGYFGGLVPKMLVAYGLLFLLAINLYGIGKWDDFSHWVPNALYLWQQDGIPGAALPAPHSVWPGYPYAVPLLTYLASHLADGFLMTGGAMFNFLFLLGFALSLPNSTKKFALAFLALLSVTLLNPAFNASFTMTSQADTASMIVVATMVMVLCDILERLKAPNNRELFLALFEAAILGSLLILIKQANIGILLFILCSFAVASLKNGVLRKGLLTTLGLLALPIFVRHIWQSYVSAQMGGNGFAVQPLAAWRWDLVAPLLKAMLQTFVKKSGTFLLIFGAIGFGIRSLFRPTTRIGNAAIIAGGTCVAYLAFLYACYLGTSFSETEIRHAASLYRYSTHLGLLPITLIWALAPAWIEKFKARRQPQPPLSPALQKGAYAILVLIFPALFLLAPPVLIAAPNKAVCALRQEAHSLITRIPSDQKIAIFEPDGDGFFSYVVNFELALSENPDHHARFAEGGTNKMSSQSPSQRLAEMPDVSMLYVQKAQGTPIEFMGSSNGSQPIFMRKEGANWVAVP